MSLKTKHLVFVLLSAIGASLALPTLAGHHEGDEQAEHSEKSRHGHKMKRRHKNMDEFMLSKVDTNQDGNIDQDEYMAHAKERFEMMDGNSDGVVTPEERKEAGDAMRKKHHEAMKAAREAYKESKQQ